jgi:protein TonB
MRRRRRTRTPTPGTLAVSAPIAMERDLNVGIGGGLGIGGDGEYLPIVKVAPVYPRRALERGITGTCLVDLHGHHRRHRADVSVVEGECDNDIFARPSIEAAYRFKYKPRVIDGEAVEVPASTTASITSRKNRR